ncbi:TetR/AcrR family transcriptional regulator [Rhodococcus sp. BL-253-APC-6A1W]|uniref:TetR/AcrR family transcriptional regulator n=1 Tax=unclassified Rhodococcus (in: high G+C Gram-positive bacteria) TaxID=192944 RepID=UPI00146B791A|nr:TetR/AcrR family transcriptional regulator [Rhodococcus sp. BL-253-APC-6A1W]NMD93794.1 TetR/AcrR family transcriptional regulator [Rhodococcus sp. BL-253-APC-6A1W]
MATGRLYGGRAGEERQADRRAQLIEAALDILGGADGEPVLSVRGVCKRAALASRYFYENFADRDELTGAVYDYAVQRIAESTLAAVVGAQPGDDRAIVRACVENIVREIGEDPRLGRMLFSVSQANPQLAKRRLASTRMFAGLVTAQAENIYSITHTPRLDLAAHYVVGGLAQAMTAWLDGTVPLDADDVVEQCTELLLTMSAQLRQDAES